MVTTVRFENAIAKLYTAFHQNTLNPEYCKQCAVGTILDNTDSWLHFSDFHGCTKLNYIGNIHQSFGRKFNGYAPLELLQMETVFLSACGYGLPLSTSNRRPENPKDKQVLFHGLCAVIEYLCDLDNIPNILDYRSIFAIHTANKPFEKVTL